MAQAPRKQPGMNSGPAGAEDILQPLQPHDYPNGWPGIMNRAGPGFDFLEHKNLPPEGITYPELDVLDSVFNREEAGMAGYNNKADLEYVNDLHGQLMELKKNGTLTSDTLRWARATTFRRHNNSWMAQRAKLAFELAHPQGKEMSTVAEPPSPAKVLYDNSDMN